MLLSYPDACFLRLPPRRAALVASVPVLARGPKSSQPFSWLFLPVAICFCLASRSHSGPCVRRCSQRFVSDRHTHTETSYIKKNGCSEHVIGRRCVRVRIPAKKVHAFALTSLCSAVHRDSASSPFFLSLRNPERRNSKPPPNEQTNHRRYTAIGTKHLFFEPERHIAFHLSATRLLAISASCHPPS